MDKLIEQAIKNCKINKYEKYFEEVCKEYKRLLDEESKQLNLPPVISSVSCNHFYRSCTDGIARCIYCNEPY